MFIKNKWSVQELFSHTYKQGKNSSFFEDSRERGAGGPTGDLQRASGFGVAAPAVAAPEAVTPELQLPSFQPAAPHSVGSPGAQTLYRRVSLYVCIADHETNRDLATSCPSWRLTVRSEGAEPQAQDVECDEDGGNDTLPVPSVAASFGSIRTVTTRIDTETLLVGHSVSVWNKLLFVFWWGKKHRNKNLKAFRSKSCT